MKAILSMALSSGSAAALLALVTSPAAAQATGAPAAAAPQTPAGDASPEIVVTARRVSENLQNVPVAITAFSQTSLNERSVANSYDLAKSVPGLVTSADSGNAAIPNFSIRGRGQVFGAATGSVETYFADVPLSPPFEIPTLPPQYFDLASVQVLKGPQGTLFGRNTTGGAVLFVPQAPTDRTEGYIRAQAGDYRNALLEGAVNIPMGDIGALRVAGFYWKRKGYADTVAGRVDSAASANAGGSFFGGPQVTLPSIDIYNQDVVELRGSLRLNLSDKIQNTTIVTWHGDRNRATNQLRALRPGSALAGGIGGFFPNLLPGDPRIADVDVDLRRPRSSTWAVVNTTLWDLAEGLKLKNILSTIQARGYGNNPTDTDGSPFPAIDVVKPGRPLRNRQYYEELQLQGHGGSLDYIVGGNVDLTRQPGAADRINVTTNTYDPGGFDEQFHQSRYTSKSLFGSLTYHAGSRLTLTAAARHTWDDILENTIVLNNNPRYVPNAPAPGQYADCAVAAAGAPCSQFLPGARKFQGWSYNAGADYKLSDAVMVYGGYRHGYKRGGFNARSGSVAGFGPEKVDDYYGGVKTTFDFGGRRATFNIEGFWDDYKGAQRVYLDFAAGALTSTIQNVPKMRYRGFDTDFMVNLTDWFRLAGNYTFVDAKYRRYPDTTIPTAIGLLTLSGAPAPFIAAFAASHPIDNNRLAANTPAFNSRHKLNLQGRFHTTLQSGVELAFLPSFSYQSRFILQDNSEVIPALSEVLFNNGQPVNAVADGAHIAHGYKTVDARIEVNNLVDRLDLSLNATNLTNKTYVIGGGALWQFGLDAVAYGPPRMVYVEARYHF